MGNEIVTKNGYTDHKYNLLCPLCWYYKIKEKITKKDCKMQYEFI